MDKVSRVLSNWRTNRLRSKDHQLSTFEYATLPRGDIRLVRFVQSSRGTIKAAITHFAVQDAPQYAALSYTWGEPGAETAIELNGQTFMVRSNLFAFLREAMRRERAAKDDIWWWIDAICINQSDDAEKSWQVMRMKDIYRDAGRVVIWLGAEADDSPLGMSFVENISSLHYKGNEPDAFLAAYRSKYATNVTAQQWRAYHRLVDRPWWERAWIVQEATTPNEIFHRIWCGQETASIGDFVSTASTLATAGIGTFTPGEGTKYQLTVLPTGEQSLSVSNGNLLAISSLLFDREAAADARHVVPTELLVDLNGFKCFDPRDKIYAFLPMLDTSTQIYTVDYSRSISETYLHFAREQLTHGHWDVLSSCMPIQGYDLPSWVPDWSNMAMTNLFPKYSWEEASRVLSPLYAANKELPDEPAKFVDDHLIVNGLEVDRIRAVSGVRAEVGDGSDEDCVADWNGFLQAINVDFEPLSHVLCADVDGYAVGHAGARRGGADACLESLNINHGLTTDMFWKVDNVRTITGSRKLIYTEGGRLGLGSPFASKDDLVCVLANCQMPFVLRKLQADYMIVGEAFVHGIMDGQAMQLGIPVQEFQIGKATSE